MADNVAFTPGSGATGATDDIGGVHYPRVKITAGADGTATDVSSAAPLPVNFTSGLRSSVTITRPADTTAYAINDVVGGAQEFTTVGVSGASVMITSVELMVEASSVISGETTYRLHLYNVTPPSASADNAAFDLPSGDRNSYLGFVDISSVSDLGSTLYIRNDGINMQVKLSGTSLFGYLTTSTAYTPTASRVYRVAIHTAGI